MERIRLLRFRLKFGDDIKKVFHDNAQRIINSAGSDQNEI